jgi:hypothetical protein
MLVLRHVLHALQVSDALAAAEPFREQLQRRGVFVVPLPVYGDDTGAVHALSCLAQYGVLHLCTCRCIGVMK